MQTNLRSVSANDPRFVGRTDAETIQNTIDFAAENGVGTVRIPRDNARTGKPVWNVDRAVLLPDDLTVELDGAHLRLADGVRDNIFRNRNAGTACGATLAGEQHDIRLVGKNGAMLDGGEPNGMSEKLCREHPGEYPPMWVNLLVWFVNVRNFSVEGLRVVESRWWALCFHYCRFGRLADLEFRMDASLRNRDGIDLRIGCEEITVENIRGLTGDDTIALTALADTDLCGAPIRVEGKSGDIRNIAIRKIRAASCGCALVRLLNADSHAIRNIEIDGIEDTGEAISAAAIRFGEGNARYAKQGVRQMGEFENVAVRNVTTSAQYALVFAEPTRNVSVEDVRAVGECAVLARFYGNFVGEKVILRRLGFAENAGSADCVFRVAPEADMRGCRIEEVSAGQARCLFREARVRVEHWQFGAGMPEEFSPESPDLPNAYARYLKA